MCSRKKGVNDRIHMNLTPVGVHRVVLRGKLGSKFKKGEFYSAISNLLEVYEIDNQNKECIFYLGKAKLALKDYKNALSDFKKFQELDPSDDVVDKLIETCEKNLSSN